MATATQVDALKEKHRAIWDSGDYGDVARRLVAEIGEIAVERAGVGPGMEVLDVACGTGKRRSPPLGPAPRTSSGSTWRPR
jgi:2-polyprenyl-3-methyl-5-hydroxy-6-metoxy-1,4-benzoquinol methylase